MLSMVDEKIKTIIADISSACLAKNNDDDSADAELLFLKFSRPNNLDDTLELITLRLQDLILNQEKKNHTRNRFYKKIITDITKDSKGAQNAVCKNGHKCFGGGTVEETVVQSGLDKIYKKLSKKKVERGGKFYRSRTVP